MKGLIRFIIGCIILVLPVGCTTDDEVQETPLVDVSISVSLADAVASRGYEDAENGDEMMHTLRIVIVRKSTDGIVEHNRLIDLTQPRTWWGMETFQVLADETKYIYFFVNEGSTKFDTNADFDFSSDIEVGKSFPYQKLSDSKVTLTGIVNGNLKMQMPTPLPMNSLYKLEVGRVSMSKTFWVTRAATKFTYIIQNNSNRDYRLSSLAISNQASTEYYMQHIDKTIPVWDESDNCGNLNIKDEITTFNTPVEGTETSHYSFVKDYSNSIAIPSEGRVKLTPIYLAETKRFEEGVYRKNDNYYTTTLSLYGLGTFTGKLGLGDSAPEGLRSDLPYQLPRNTHVVITVSINQSEVTWEVDLYPYTGIYLEPGFGL